MEQRPWRDPQGFSLVEVVVAMVLLTIGVLCLAASARSVTRLTSQGARVGQAAIVVASRLERLRAGACDALAGGGSAISGPFTERWTVEASGAVGTVTITVSYPDGAVMRYDTLGGIITCDQRGP